MRIINRPSFVLDQISAPAAAGFALRLTRAGWWGNPLCNVRRGSDNAARDIYHDRDGNLDWYDLLSFCGSSSCYVTTWYDQSGNARNATQATSTAQPMIVNAGALVTLNGEPALRFSGAWFSFIGALSQPNTVNIVHRWNSYVSAAHLFDGINATPRTLIGANGPTIYQQYAGTINNISGLANGVTNVVTAIFNGSSSAFRLNGAQTATNPGTNGMNSQIIGGGQGGSQGGAITMDGWMQEFVIVNAVASTSDNQTLERNQGQYFGATVA